MKGRGGELAKMLDDKDQHREEMADSGRCIRKERGNGGNTIVILSVWPISKQLSL